MISAAIIAVIAILVVAILYSAVRILREYERGVVFTLGRYTGTKGPGFFLLVPIIQQMVRVDLRVVVDEVPPQDVISRDNVSVKVNAVIYFRVVDAERAHRRSSGTSLAALKNKQYCLGGPLFEIPALEHNIVSMDVSVSAATFSSFLKCP